MSELGFVINKQKEESRLMTHFMLQTSDDVSNKH